MGTQRGVAIVERALNTAPGCLRRRGDDLGRDRLSREQAMVPQNFRRRRHLGCGERAALAVAVLFRAGSFLLFGKRRLDDFASRRVASHRGQAGGLGMFAAAATTARLRRLLDDLRRCDGSRRCIGVSMVRAATGRRVPEHGERSRESKHGSDHVRRVRERIDSSAYIGRRERTAIC